MMQNTTTVSLQLTEGQKITLETGLLARQAAGSVIAYLNDTLVFSAVTNTSAPREGIDYFPLQVEYREKFYASGKFPGGYFKRESRPSERETLIARATDRPIRPLFPDGYRNDVQIVNNLISSDRNYDSDILSVIAASTALHISDVPFMGPIAAVRIGRINGNFILNPTQDQRFKSDLDLLYSGTREKFLMMEGGADEISKEDFLAAMKFAHDYVVKIIDMQHELRRKLGLPEKVVVQGEAADKSLLDNARAKIGDRFAQALTIPGKLERQGTVETLKTELKAAMLAETPDMADEAFRAMFDALEIELVRKNVLDFGKRIDGRGQKDVRPLAAQIGVLPRAHGSVIFDRGETQSLGVVTLGTKSDVQEMDAIAGGPVKKSFFLHYNFPPYSVGEVGRLGTTSRREVGHGALAERSLLPVIPEDYPYTVRLVSEIMGSNGSSSMASICVGSLALMDAGVPIKSAVAGISAGLFTSEDGSKSIIVTDILGAEDHCGDMDFKVGGTRKGITGFQVDLKIPGLTWAQVEEALEQTHTARMKILDYMDSVIAAPRSELSQYAPRIETVKIPEDMIGELIGPGGKNIRAITEMTGTQIDIAEDGTVSIFATSHESMEMAKREVLRVAAEPEEGKIYDGVVTGIKDFGAFVEILPGKDGMCHISELSDKRVHRVEDICKVGDKMKVKCLMVDERGRVKLSRREALRERGEQG